VISPAGEHLYLPPSLRYFVPLGAEARDLGPHACFEYDIVEATRPEMVVDLGSGNALSFAVFCQSMKDHLVDGLACAVDVWESDEIRESEGSIPLTTINNFLHTHFRGQAYLLKLSLEQALAHFADRSVDLLRIDLERADRPLAALLDAWTPKLKAGAVMLIAGINVRANALHDIETRSPLIFPGASGLAVTIHELAAANAQLHPLMELISQGPDADKQGLVRFYEHAALHHTLRSEIAESAYILYRKRPGPIAR
jgi:hypothetical protein